MKKDYYTTITDLLENYEHENTYSLHSRKLSLLVKLQTCVPRLLACFSCVLHQHSKVNARYKMAPKIITLTKQTLERQLLELFIVGVSDGMSGQNHGGKRIC